MDQHSAFLLFMFVKAAKSLIVAIYLWNLIRKANHVINKAPYYAWMAFIAIIMFFDGMSWPLMWDELVHSVH